MEFQFLIYEFAYCTQNIEATKINEAKKQRKKRLILVNLNQCNYLKVQFKSRFFYSKSLFYMYN